MTIDLKPELEALIQKRLESGAFQDAEEAWLELHKLEIGERIDRAIAQIDRGEGMTPEQSRT